MNRLSAVSFRLRRPGILALWGDLCAESGDAIIELALVIGFLFVPVILGLTDMGTLMYGYTEISSAAHAGAMVGMPNSTDASSTNSAITTAARAEASFFPSSSVTVTPTPYWVCNTAQGGTQYTGTNAQTNANAACTSPEYALEFIQVTVSAPLTLPFHCCGLPASTTLTSTAVMEVEGQQ